MSTRVKTKPTDVSPKDFIDTVANEQRRKDAHELVAMMRKITGEPPKMWGGSIVGFGQYQGKHRRGKGCLYVNKLDDVDRGVLRELIANSVIAMRTRHS